MHVISPGVSFSFYLTSFIDRFCTLYLFLFTSSSQSFITIPFIFITNLLVFTLVVTDGFHWSSYVYKPQYSSRSQQCCGLESFISYMDLLFPGFSTRVFCITPSIKTGFTVTFRFHNFSNSQVRSWYIYHFSLWFNFTLSPTWTAKSNYYYYYYFTPWEFFSSANANGLSLKFEWKQVSSNLQDPSQYSGWSQQCCCLDGLLTSSYFQVFQSMNQFFGDYTKNITYNRYNRHFHVPHFFFNSLARSRYLSFFSLFTQWSAETALSTIQQVLFSFFFFCWFCWSSGRDLVIVCISKSPRRLCVSFSKTDSGLCVYHLFTWSNFNFLHNP